MANSAKDAASALRPPVSLSPASSPAPAAPATAKSLTPFALSAPRPTEDAATAADGWSEEDEVEDDCGDDADDDDGSDSADEEARGASTSTAEHGAVGAAAAVAAAGASSAASGFSVRRRLCRPADWQCFLGCGKRYKKSSGRSIRRHALQCYRRHFPADCAGRSDGQVHELLAGKHEDGRVNTGLRAWRLRQSRRAAHDLPPHERWECPNGCRQCYRSTSSKSIERHMDTCTGRSLAKPQPQQQPATAAAADGGGSAEGGRHGRASMSAAAPLPLSEFGFAAAPSGPMSGTGLRNPPRPLPLPPPLPAS